MKKITSLLALAIIAIACQEKKNDSDRLEFVPDHDANPVATTADMIAYKSGIENWKDVSELRFTFNVDRGANHFERSWSWKPKTDDVTLYSEKDTIAYNRKKMDSLIMKTDQGFINDSYWLLAPFKLVWDEGTRFSEPVSERAPISKDTLQKITITYGNDGGYTPGDAYDFYYDQEYMVREWVFRKGNDSIPSMITTFEDYEDFNGLTLAKMHQDSTGSFKLYFSNISVKK